MRLDTDLFRRRHMAATATAREFGSHSYSRFLTAVQREAVVDFYDGLEQEVKERFMGEIELYLKTAFQVLDDEVSIQRVDQGELREPHGKYTHFATYSLSPSELSRFILTTGFARAQMFEMDEISNDDDSPHFGSEGALPFATKPKLTLKASVEYGGQVIEPGINIAENRIVARYEAGETSDTDGFLTIEGFIDLYTPKAFLADDKISVLLTQPDQSGVEEKLVGMVRNHMAEVNSPVLTPMMNAYYQHQREN